MVISSTPVLPPAGFAQSQPVTKTDTVADQVNTSHSSLNRQQAPSYLRRILIISRQWRHKSNVHHVKTMKTSIKCSSCWHNKDLSHMFSVSRQWRPQSTVYHAETMKTSINCSIMSRQWKHQSTVHHVETMQTSINCSSCRDNENVNQLFIMSRQWKHQSNVHHVETMKTLIKCSSCQWRPQSTVYHVNEDLNQLFIMLRRWRRWSWLLSRDRYWPPQQPNHQRVDKLHITGKGTQTAHFTQPQGENAQPLLQPAKCQHTKHYPL